MYTTIIVRYRFHDDDDNDDGTAGIREVGGGGGDARAGAAVSPAFIATYDSSLALEDVAVDSRSPGDKPPCGWRRRQRRRPPGPPPAPPRSADTARRRRAE